MIERSPYDDRRSEPRFDAAERVTWAKPGSGLRFKGWLSDRAESSFSFLTASWCEPSYGEPIDIMEGDRPVKHCQVKRIVPFDNDMSLVACKAENLVVPGKRRAAIAESSREAQGIGMPTQRRGN